MGRLQDLASARNVESYTSYAVLSLFRNPDCAAAPRIDAARGAHYASRTPLTSMDAAMSVAEKTIVKGALRVKVGDAPEQLCGPGALITGFWATRCRRREGS